MKKILLLLLLIVMMGCSNTSKKANKNDIRASIKTNKGEINVFLYPDGAPLTVANFVNLAQRGFYNNLSFHRVVEDFVIQGGDPKGSHCRQDSQKRVSKCGSFSWARLSLRCPV